MILFYPIIFILLLIAFVKSKSEQLHSFNQRETLPLRGILAVCVLLCHLLAYFDNFVVFADEIGPISVATFFLLTGYGLGISYKHKGKTYLDGFFKKRLGRLVLPFLIMTFVYQVYLAVNGQYEVAQLFIHPFPKHWFIYALLIWYCAYFFAFRYCNSLKLSLIAIWLFSLVYIAVFVYMHNSLYWVSILPLPMGITYAFFETDVVMFISQKKRQVLIGGIIILIFGAVYLLYSKVISPLPGWGPITYTYLPFYIMLLTYIYGGWKNRVTNFLGSISYEFYVVHGFIVMQVGEYGDYGLGTIGCLISIVVCFILSVLFGYGLSNIQLS